jgi:hypothetical protein
MAAEKGRKPAENEITKLFEAKKGNPTVEDVLMNRDVLKALQLEPAEYVEFLLSPKNLELILTYALDAPLDRRDPALPRLSATAARVLSYTPARTFQDRLHRPPTPASDILIRKLRDFPNTANGRSNPIFAGHFQEIFLAALRSNPELLRTAFQGFVSSIVAHAELSGYQDILVNLCTDRADTFASPHQPIEGYRLIARRALLYAEDYVRTHEVVFCRRVQGIIGALWQVFTEKQPDDYAYVAQDVGFIRPLAEAVFTAPLEPDMFVAFREGVALLQRLMVLGRIYEKAVSGEGENLSEVGKRLVAVRKFLKHFAIGFYEFQGVKTANWETTDLTPVQRMLVDAFPVLWPGGVDYMFPLFFACPPVSPEFNRTFLERVCGFSRVRFLTFVHDHGILDRIVNAGEQSPVGAALGQRGARNPQIWQLANFIATGTFRKPKAGVTPRPYATPDEYKEEYERFSPFVVSHVLPYLNEVANAKAKNTVE